MVIGFMLYGGPGDGAENQVNGCNFGLTVDHQPSLSSTHKSLPWLPVFFFCEPNYLGTRDKVIDYMAFA